MNSDRKRHPFLLPAPIAPLPYTVDAQEDIHNPIFISLTIALKTKKSTANEDVLR